jgi:hypothetical protein
MDGSRFDRLARFLAGGASRRGVLGGLLGLGAGLVGIRPTGAQTCLPGRIYRRGVGCICKLTGRPPAGGTCPCPRGQIDTGDGQGCLACRGDADCPSPQVCLAGACGCEAPRVLLANGSCAYPCTIDDECAAICGGSFYFCDPVEGGTFCIHGDHVALCPPLSTEPCAVGTACFEDGNCHPLC